MPKSKYPPIKVSEILDHDPCEEGWEKAVEHFGDLQKNDELDIFDLLEWGEHICWLMNEKLINLSHQDAIIAYADPGIIRMFAEYVEGADIDKLEDAIIACADAQHIRFFADYVQGANMDKLENALTNLGDVYEIKMFLEYVKNSDKTKLKKPSRDPKDNF